MMSRRLLLVFCFFFSTGCFSVSAQTLPQVTAVRLSRAFALYVNDHFQKHESRKPANDTLTKARSDFQEGIIRLSEGKFKKAIAFFSASLNSFKEINDAEGMTVAATAAGLSRWLNNDPEKALQYFYTAYDLSKEKQITAIEPVISALMGSVYLLKNDTTLARSFLSDSWKKRKRADARIMTVMMATAGELALMQNHYSIAQVYFENQLSLALTVQDAGLKSKALFDLGLMNFKKGDFEAAVSFLDQSMETELRLIAVRLKKDALLKAASLFSFKQQYDKADFYHERYRSLKDTLENLMGDRNQRRIPAHSEAEQRHIISLLESHRQETTRIIKQHDLELSRQMTATEMERQIKESALEELNVAMIEKREKEKELLELQKRQAEQQLELWRTEVELEKNKRLIIILLAAALMVIAAALFFYNRYRFKKKANRELQQALNQLKATQDQLVHSQKMASLGQYTAGLAHEIQNPLNFVNNFSEVALELFEELKQASPVRQQQLFTELETALTRINFHGERASAIIKNMLLQSRNRSAGYEPASINPLVKSAVEFAITSYRSSHPGFHFRLIENYDPSGPVVRLNQQDISRVIINLVTNALQAMTENKTKGFSFHPELGITVNRQNKEVRIAVSNTGPAIPPQIKEKIFTPFFTTKPPGSGTGLGLSICYDIVTKGHQGTMFFTSDDRETCFVFTLPVNEES